MKLLITSLLLALAACGSTHQSLGSGTSATTPGTACDVPCDANVQCLPNGNCQVTCTGPNGQTCAVELACDGAGCHVVSSACAPAGSCTSEGKPAKPE